MAFPAIGTLFGRGGLPPRILKVQQCRGLFRPPSNVPFGGIYRTDGEIVRRDDLLVVQMKMNYHPGQNVRFMEDRRQKYLKANCDGTVMITREKANVDPSNEYMKTEYGYRDCKDLYKLTFNVIPRRMSNTFVLKEVV